MMLSSVGFLVATLLGFALILTTDRRWCPAEQRRGVQIAIHCLVVTTIAVSACRTYLPVKDLGVSQDLFRTISEAAWLASSLSSVVVLHVELSKGPRMLTTIYWLLSSISAALLAYDALEHMVVADAYYLVCIWSFILSVATCLCIGGQKHRAIRAPTGQNLDAVEVNEKDVALPQALEASHWSYLGYHWLWALLRKGLRTSVTAEDWPELPPTVLSVDTTEEFEALWYEASSKGNPSLAWSIFRFIWKEILASAVLAFIAEVALVGVVPILMRGFLVYFDERKADPTISLLPGVLLAVGFSLAPLGTTIIKGFCFHLMQDASTKAQSALINSLYARIFARSSEVQVEQAGTIVNQLSVDLDKVRIFLNAGKGNVHSGWTCPALLAVYVFYLYHLIGSFAFIPIVSFIGVMVFSTWWGNYASTVLSRSVSGRAERAKVELDMMHSMRAIKLGDWGEVFRQKLFQIRDTLEIPHIMRQNILLAYSLGVVEHFPVLATVITLGSYGYWSGDVLTPALAFPVMQMLRDLEIPMYFFYYWVLQWSDFVQAAARLQTSVSDHDTRAERMAPSAHVDQGAVQMERAICAHTRGGQLALQEISLDIEPGSLYGIVGRVGSGKSSICRALLGELHLVSGKISMSGTVAYTAQQPWIMSASIRDNILFGSAWDQELYSRTIRACNLDVDLAALPEGDKSFVGEQGIQLSGGQRARVSLARAVYAQADVYIIDDVLAAVDQHTVKHLVDEVFLGMLSDKTRIIVSNSLQAMYAAEHLVLLENGRIMDTCMRKDAQDPVTAIGRFIAHAKNMASNNAHESDTQHVAQDGEEVRESDEVKSTTIMTSSETAELVGSRSSIRRFCQYMGFKGLAFYLLLMACAFGTFFTAPIWLQRWTARNSEAHRTVDIRYYVLWGLAIYASGCFLLSFQLHFLARLRNKATSRIYREMVESLLRAPMSFFETVNSGQVITRLNGDFYKVELNIQSIFNMMNAGWVFSAGVFLYIGIVQPVLIVLMVLLCPVFFLISRYFLATASQIVKSEADMRAILYGSIKESSLGIETIRAFAKSRYLTRKFGHSVDNYMRATYGAFACRQWMYIQLNTAFSALIVAVPLMSLYWLYRGYDVSTAATATAISVAAYSTVIRQLVDQTTAFLVEVVSIDRCFQYVDLEPEEDKPTQEPWADWPGEGRIVFKDYAMRYRPELPLALKNINLTIKSHEKVGFVGRTGAGKSSIIMGLFRILQAAEGQILIDGVDISKISLHRLRTSIATIPQDAAMFKGTLRANLDLEQSRSDAELWEVLRQCQLQTFVESLPDSLDTEMGDGQSKFSVGQRQLLSVARTFLDRSRILVLDEATASVDSETDKLIQQSIREVSKHRTVLTIAHRINTVMDCDKIVVLQDGAIAEQGSPQALLEQKGLFYDLAKEAKVVAGE